MANVIEVVLNLQDKMSGGMEKALLSLGALAGKLPGFVGVVAATSTALVGMAAKLAVDIEQLDNLSARTGISAHNLQVLEFAFKQSGVGAESLAIGMSFLQRAIVNNDPILAKIGVTSHDSFTAFMQAARGISAMGESSERTNAIMALFSRGGPQMAGVLNKIAAGYNDVAEAATESGNVLSEDQLDRMRKLDERFDSMSASVAGFGKQLAVMVAGPLTDFLEKSNKKGGWNPSNPIFSALAMLGRPSQHEQDIADAEREEKLRRESAKRGDQILRDRKAAHAREPAGPAQGVLGDLGASGGPDLGRAFGPAMVEANHFEAELHVVASKIETSMQAIGDSLESGILNVFLNLTNKSQTFGSAMKSIFDSLVQGILSAIGSLVAELATSGFITLLGWALGPYTGGASVGAARAINAGRGAGRHSMGGGNMSGGGNTFIIQTISAKDTISSLVSPMGEFRSANSRLAEIAAAS